MVKSSWYDDNGVKKGAWSEDEDNKLRAYIQRYGHWNWGLLPKFAGVSRTDLQYQRESCESPSYSSLSEISSSHWSGSDCTLFSEFTPQILDDELVGNFWTEPFLLENYAITQSGENLLSTFNYVNEFTSQSSCLDFMMTEECLWSKLEENAEVYNMIEDLV
ncbi:hypothetical protein L1887_30177 [Cichorium endivia]|nr:hypothetical protein L1887_30177 [Cichorium endivia]